MHLFSLLSVASLVLAAPQGGSDNCVSKSFDVRGFTVFTADPGPQGSSHINFQFQDENTNTGSGCSRSLPLGSGQSPADPVNFYPCQDAAFQYKFDGKKLTLKHTFDCNGTVQTSSSAEANVALFCYTMPLFGGGTQCQTPADFSVPVTSIVA